MAKSTRLQKVEENLKCAICIEVFRDPVTLPCQHTFCRPCLQMFSEKSPPVPTGSAQRDVHQVSCPVCRTPADLGSLGVTELPQNRALADIADICRQGTCPLQSCVQHGQPYSIYCIPCTKLICIACLRGHHGHGMSDIQTVHSELKTSLVQKTKECGKVNGELAKSASGWKNLGNDVEKNGKLHRVEIERAHCSAQEALNKWRDTSLNAVTKQEEQWSSQCKASLNQLEAMTKRTQEQITASDNLTSSSDDTQFVQDARQLTTEIHNQLEEDQRAMETLAELKAKLLEDLENNFIFPRHIIVKEETTYIRNRVKDSPGRREDDAVDEYEPNVDFQPVISLPDLVEVKTGEEEEDKLFSERCRLFRFDPETKQWKERGVGEIKILLHKKTNRIRIIMRRDQVLKLCANHYLSADMKLSKMASSDKSWCWNAVDYVDEEVKNEQLAARFKNADIAANFKAVFEDSINKIKGESEVSSSTDVPASKPPATTADAAKTKATAADTKPLSELFKPAEGSWECSGCFIRNDGSVKKCPACRTMKPGIKPEDVKEKPSSTSAFGGTGAAGSGFKFGSSGLTFGATASTGFRFGGSPATGSKEASVKPAPDSSTGFIFGSAATQSKEASGKAAPDSSTGFVFGSPAVQSKDASSKTVSSTTSGFTFSASAQNKEGIKPSGDNSGFVFGTADVKKEAPSNKAPESASGPPSTIIHEVSKPVAKDASKTDASNPLSELFKKAEGSWECSGCFIRNDGSVKKCPACSTMKPGVKPEDVKEKPSSTSAFGGTGAAGSGFKFGSSGFTFGATSSTGFTFGGSPAIGSKGASVKPAPDSSTGFIFGLAATQSKEASGKVAPDSSTGFVFGSPAVQSKDASSKTVSSTTSGFTFSASAQNKEGIKPSGDNSGFVFGTADVKKEAPSSKASESAKGPTSTIIHEVSKPVAKDTSKTDASISLSELFKKAEGSWECSGCLIVNGADIQKCPACGTLQPGVKPEDVKQTSGEEDEEVLFCQLSKLFRFDKQAKQWKERGIGEMKVLKHKQTGAYRLLQRREQVLTISCNHLLTPDLQLKAMSTSDTSWCWTAPDYAEGESKIEQFAIKFKNVTLAKEFKEIFEHCQNATVEQAKRDPQDR